MVRSVVRFPYSFAPRLRRAQFAAPAVVGALAALALAALALAAPSAAAAVPAVATPKVIATIRLPEIPSAAAVSPRTGTVYIASNLLAKGAIEVVNGTTHKVATTIADADMPTAIAVSPQSGDVYVVNQGFTVNGSVHPSGVWVVNWRTSKVTTSIPVPPGDLPLSVAVSPATGDVYVAVTGDNPEAGGVLVISGKTNKVAAVIKDGDSPDEIAVSPRTGDVYVVNWGTGPNPGRGDSVSVISGKTNKIIATIADPHAPRGVAVSPVTGDVWVINEDYVTESGGVPYPGSVEVLNGRTNKIINDIADPNNPDAIAVSPRTGDVYIGDQGIYNDFSPDVQVLSGRNLHVIAILADIADPSIPGSVAVSPKTGDAYVTNGYLNSQSVWVLSD